MEATFGSHPSKEHRPDPERYIAAIRSKIGPEVGSARLFVQNGQVVCYAGDVVGIDYIDAIHEHGPQTWQDTEAAVFSSYVVHICMDCQRKFHADADEVPKACPMCSSTHYISGPVKTITVDELLDACEIVDGWYP